MKYGRNESNYYNYTTDKPFPVGNLPERLRRRARQRPLFSIDGPPLAAPLHLRVAGTNQPRKP